MRWRVIHSTLLHKCANHPLCSFVIPVCSQLFATIAIITKFFLWFFFSNNMCDGLFFFLNSFPFSIHLPVAMHDEQAQYCAWHPLQVLVGASFVSWIFIMPCELFSSTQNPKSESISDVMCHTNFNTERIMWHLIIY